MSASEVRFPNEYESKLETRIRELEAADEVHWKTRRSLLASIAKAKAILTQYLDGAGSCGVYDIRDALAALEGK